MSRSRNPCFLNAAFPLWSNPLYLSALGVFAGSHKALLDTTITAIAYETIEAKDGTLPILIPMSEIAGRMSVQIGARYLEKTQGGRGLL